MFMNAILLCLYAAACVAYAVQFARRTFDASRVATVLLVLAAFAHTFVIGMETMRVGHVPIASATSAISSFVWLLALSYLYIELTTLRQSLVGRKNRKLRRVRELYPEIRVKIFYARDYRTLLAKYAGDEPPRA